MKSIYEYILEQLVNESNMVHFGKQIEPKYGWFVILIGGTGSGKGAIQNFIDKKTNHNYIHLAINAKTLDVDKFKKFLLKQEAIKKGLEGSEIDDYIKQELSNKQRVSQLHQEVKDMRLKEIQRSNLFNNNNLKNKDTLPNIIIDITGKDIADIADLVYTSNPIGYKIKIIWCLTDLETAMFRNNSRGRNIDDNIVKLTHKGTYNTAIKLMYNEGNFNNLIDSFDVVLNSGSSEHGNQTDTELHDSVFSMIRKDNDFEIPKKYKERFDNLSKAVKSLR